MSLLVVLLSLLLCPVVSEGRMPPPGPAPVDVDGDGDEYYLNPQPGGETRQVDREVRLQPVDSQDQRVIVAVEPLREARPPWKWIFRIGWLLGGFVRA